MKVKKKRKRILSGCLCDIAWPPLLWGVLALTGPHLFALSLVLGRRSAWVRPVGPEEFWRSGGIVDMRMRQRLTREEYHGVEEVEQGIALCLWVWALDTAATSLAVALELPSTRLLMLHPWWYGMVWYGMVWSRDGSSSGARGGVQAPLLSPIPWSRSRAPPRILP